MEIFWHMNIIMRTGGIGIWHATAFEHTHKDETLISIGGEDTNLDVETNCSLLHATMVHGNVSLFPGGKSTVQVTKLSLNNHYEKEVAGQSVSKSAMWRHKKCESWDEIWIIPHFYDFWDTLSRYIYKLKRKGDR